MGTRRLAALTANPAIPWRSSLVIASAGVALVILRLLWPVASGLADNGDGPRYICQLGFVPADSDEPRYWDHPIMQWVWSPSGGRGSDWCGAYPSSHVWILRIAAMVTAATGAPDHLDLRWVILGYAVLVGLLTGAVAFLIARGLAARVLIAGAFLSVMSDPAFAGYAGSILGELPGIVGISLIAVGAVFAGTCGSKRLAGLAAVAAGSVLALTSKPQAATLVLPIAAFLLTTAIQPAPDAGPAPPGGALRQGFAHRVLSVAISAVLLVPAGWVLAKNPDDIQTINPWELISVGILGHSDDPAADLREMGFPGELAEYAGDSVWTDDSILHTPAWDENAHLMTYGTVATFLLAHPDRAVGIADRAARDYFATRPDYLGNYPVAAGRAPGELAFSPLATLARPVAGGGLALLIALWTAIVAINAARIRRSPRGSAGRAFATAALLMVGIAVVQFFTAAFGEAIENTKHLVFAILAGFLAAVLTAGSCLADPRRHGAREPGTGS